MTQLIELGAKISSSARLFADLHDSSQGSDYSYNGPIPSKGLLAPLLNVARTFVLENLLDLFWALWSADKFLWRMHFFTRETPGTLYSSTNTWGPSRLGPGTLELLANVRWMVGKCNRIIILITRENGPNPSSNTPSLWWLFFRPLLSFPVFFVFPSISLERGTRC